MKAITVEAAVQSLGAGARVFVPGSSGAPPLFIEALENGADVGGLDITTTAIPGVNMMDVAKMNARTRVTGLFMHPGLAAAQRAGRYRHWPVSYAAFQSWIDTHARFDAVIVQAAPPDAQGQCALGPAVEFTLDAIARSARVIGVLNQRTPRIAGGPSVPLAAFASVVEADAPLAAYDPGASGGQADSVARHVAGLIDDGARVQIGLGKIPSALMAHLRDRRGLKFWSGMLSDGVLDLIDAGALDPGAVPTACVYLGTEAFYRRLDGRDDLAVVGCSLSHDMARLLAFDDLVAVNGALEVDLFGQCNLERADGRAISGAGGAPDFAGAARRARNGKSIIALPAALGARSKIKPVLDGAAMVTLPRTEVDFIVTEYGVADLRAASVDERAERIIAIAAPEHRAALADAWREIARAL